MARKVKAVLGPSRLSQILLNLNKSPKPQLSGVKSLRLTLALKNDHFGARHFVKEDLPRIQYANTNVSIHVDKRAKTKEESWNPEMVLEFRNGDTKSIDLANKWSANIFQELMDTAGGSSWTRWKNERQAAGLPILEGMRENASPFARTSPDHSKKGAAAVLP
ncbi:hypothetical protein EWM64_g6859 [Hericium alpestre]|uniref:Ribosomal protein/NADH dehydrogenase domain-containing protein n=1 Tax=Hericium alpestre TaxID=135208 RepID=A0A4Y9ZQV2_9AGAM|nr:hypothetical protein EWM64_g6859 [Hericium alpestre]